MEFTDSRIQTEFNSKGYVVIDFLDSSEIESLKKTYEGLSVKQVSDFQVSNYEKNPELNKQIDVEIKKIISGKISRHIKDFRLLTSYFYIKYPGKDSAFYIHKDWNVVDERKDTSVHIWIPLTDTTDQNGNMFFCPYDSNKNNILRGSPGFEHPRPNMITNLINRIYQKDVYTKSGQAIFFKHNMTHGSRANLSDTVRIAAGISLIPEHAQLVHYHRNKSGEIKKHLVKDDFYLNFDLNRMPEQSDLSVLL